MNGLTTSRPSMRFRRSTLSFVAIFLVAASCQTPSAVPPSAVPPLGDHFAATPAESATDCYQAELAAEHTPETDAAAKSDNWQFNAMAFGWLVGLHGSVNDGALGGTINESFGDLLENLNGAFMGSFVARKGQWGAQADLTWAKLDTFTTGMVTTTDVDIEMVVGEIDVLFSPERAEGLDFLVGARVLNLDSDVSIGTGATNSGSETFVDPIIGAQGNWELGDHWRFGLRGDIGGFGAASKLTYQALGMFRWEFAEAWGLDLGYRLVGYDLNKGDTNLDMQLHGPLIGVDLTF